MDPTSNKTPASAPISAAIGGAAVLAIQAIIPLSTGAQLNYALMAATFIVTFGTTLYSALYHIQVPSPIQRNAIAEVAGLVTAAVSAHTHTLTVPQPPIPVESIPPSK